MAFEDIFDQVLLDHYRHPRNFKKIENPDYEMEGANPLCGDEIHLQVKMNGGGTISEVAFTGKACAICTASTSMFCEQASGKSSSDLDDQKKVVKHMLEGVELHAEEKHALGDMYALKGVSKLPVRVKCAMLVWETWELINKTLRQKSNGAASS